MDKKSNLDGLQYFFKADLFVKKTLYNIAPREEYFLSDEKFIDYQDKVFEGLQDIRDSLLIATNKLDYNLDNYINDFFNSIKIKLYSAKNDYQEFRKIYQELFSNMNSDFIEKVGNKCVGYLLFRNLYSLLPECKTINELLHLLHSYIINNEEIYEKNPIVYQKSKHNEYHHCTLYGDKNDQSDVMNVAKEIYAEMLNDNEVWLFHILPISNQNKIIMMFRDRGHALTIEADLEGNNLILHYFIPKICNIDMVNALPGIHKITEKDNFATGMFIISKDNAALKIFNFVTKVPTDEDMLRFKKM